MHIRPSMRLFFGGLFALLISLTGITTSTAQGVPTITLGGSANVHLIPPGKITANGEKVMLTFMVTDESGGLAHGVKFRGSGASAGRLDTDCPQVGQGMYNCYYSTPLRKPRAGVVLRIRGRLSSGSTVESSFPLQVEVQTKPKIAFSASPEKIVLSEDPSSSLVFDIRDKDGSAITGLTLKANANVGEVQALSPAGDGRYTAVYIPPSVTFPQVAIISIWDADHPDRAFGFFSIPLIGKVPYPVDARQAGVTLIFRVGETTFPPVVSDATGKANIPIIVPPGMPNGSVEMIQPDGNRSTQTIPLGVPPFNRIAMGGIPDFLPADGTFQTQVRAYVVDEEGKPADGEDISFSATQGTLDEVSFLGSGLYAATYTAPQLSSSSRVTITASLVGQEAASSDSVEIGLEPGGPARIKITTKPERITPNVKKVKVTAELLDAEGQVSTAGHRVEFRTEKGPIKNPKVVAPGVFSVEVPVQWNVKTRIQALAGVRGNRQRAVQLVALPMSDQVVTGQKIPVTVLALDRFGNPVSQVAVNATAASGGGSVTSSVETDARGIGTVLYSAGPLAGLATIDFSIENRTYTAPIWQALDPIPNFEFPLSGGQDRVNTLGKWMRLREARTLGVSSSPADAAPSVTTTGSPWSGAATAETSTPIVPDKTSTARAGVASTIEVAAVPSSVPRTGGAVNLLVRVLDKDGTLVPGETVILLADSGMVSNKVDNGDGTFSALLTIPPGDSNRVQVTATRPQGDVASFATISVGGSGGADKRRKVRKPRTRTKAPVAAKVTPSPAASKKPNGKTITDPKEAARRRSMKAGRLSKRTAQLTIGWSPGFYHYDSQPCDGTAEPCSAPGDSSLQNFDFLKSQVRAPLLGSVAINAEWFPFQEYVGVRAGFSHLTYSTDFDAEAPGGTGYCGEHFCDGMSMLNIDFQGRLPLLKDKGPLDIVARVGYQFQDLVLFRRLWNPSDLGADSQPDACPVDDDATEQNEASRTGCTSPVFETMGLHGVRVGIGARYTIIPMLRPHIDYDLSLGIAATLGDSSFQVPGVTNHHLNVGMSVLPWKGLLIDLSYDLTTRSMGLAFFNEQDNRQRGEIDEQMHTVRLSAGWAF